MLDTTIVAGDSVVFSYNCVVTGGCEDCIEIDGTYNRLHRLLFEGEDSVHIIFNHEKIFRYVRQKIGSCAGEDVLLQVPLPSCVDALTEDDGLVYTFEITNKYYENAEPIEGGG